MNPKNLHIKEEIIKLTEKLLDLENENSKVEVIDKQAQSEIKNHIDDLVFCLYFDVEIEKIKENEFYKFINQ